MPKDGTRITHLGRNPRRSTRRREVGRYKATLMSPKENTMANGNDNGQYLGNDSEVVQLPADTTPADAGWGEDAAVVEVPKQGQ
ncbi:hypothetical protein SEA_YARA_88 [Streptomyces phage Yara]|nr:hypothetical protein SEA_YARA_88 [Streptomyces phage Yara]